MKKILIAVLSLSSVSAFAQGVRCESVEKNDAGQSYSIEAHIGRNQLTKLLVEWSVTDEQGHRDDFDTLVENGSAVLNKDYEPRSATYKGYSDYQTDAGDSHSSKSIDILLPEDMSGENFTGFVRVVEEHAGVIANEEMICNLMPKW